MSTGFGLAEGILEIGALGVAFCEVSITLIGSITIKCILEWNFHLIDLDLK